MNEEGEVVTDKSKAIGPKHTHKLTRHILFADQFGYNTDQNDNGNYGGEKQLAKRGSAPKQMCSSSDAH